MKKQNTLKSNTFAATFAAILISGTTLAADKVEFADTDGNGVISAEEITAAREANKAARLAEFDVDGNGELSRDERRAAKDARYDDMLINFDADGDGELSREERQAAKDARRAAVETILDVNGDGELSDEETAGIEQVKEERGEKKSGKRRGRKGDKNRS